jgi:hypothetical protein
LILEKISDNFYKAENENIELIIKVIDSKTIEIEVVKGYIIEYSNGGFYFEKTVDLSPEKQTLTFVRDLTAEDEGKLLNK